MNSPTITIKGLSTYPNPIGDVPKGSLAIADNIVIDADGTAQSRRGFDILAGSFGVLSDRVNTFVEYQTQLLVSYGTDKLAYWLAGVYTNYVGSFAAPDPLTARMKFVAANSNLYFTTNTGVKKLDIFTGTPRDSGSPQGLDLVGTLSGGAGFFNTNAQVAYRVIWGYRDLNNNLILGAPSERAIVVNSSGFSSNVSLTFTIPATITTAFFYQIYRSPQTVSSTIQPNDELQQVFESNPTSAQLIAGTVTILDITPDALRGATIYTAASQEGILQANAKPPLSKDICLFKGYTFFANTTSLSNIKLTLLAVGGGTGVAVGDVLTIGSVNYIGAIVEDSTTNPVKFQVVTTGTPAQNITDTTHSLNRVINQTPLNTNYYAYYISGSSDLPGQIYLATRALGNPDFAITASMHGSAWLPVLPTIGTTVQSKTLIQSNAIYVSKSNQPEAVPTTNLLFLGSAAFPIKRIIPLRDSIFVFKDDGIFRIVGQTIANFYVDNFDNTSKLLAPESAVNLNNTIYCLTDQGVVSVSETGISVVSRAIEGNLLALFGANLTSVENFSFGISYQSDRKYILGIISNTGDLNPTQMYIYNLFTNSWTRWPLSKTCGIVKRIDDKLYLGDALGNDVNIERKNYDFTDFVDSSFPVTIISVVDKTIQLLNATGIQVGDLLFESTTIRSVIDSVNLLTNIITVIDTLPWVVGAATIFTAIQCDIQFQPQTGENPQELKQFSEIELFFRRARFVVSTLSFFSDSSQSVNSINITINNFGPWGLFPWGSVPWGDQVSPIPIRTYVPLDKQRCSQLNIKFTHRTAYGDFLLNGISLKVRMLSERVAK